MIDFKTVAPKYERPVVVRSRDDLAKLGCSAELIDKICPHTHPRMFVPLCRPEDWFWADRRTFGRGGPWVEELYRIAGGCFADLPLGDQCVMLGLRTEVVRARKAGRGKWIGNQGDAVAPETVALQKLLKPGEVGFEGEGTLISMICNMVSRIGYLDPFFEQPKHFIERMLPPLARAYLHPASSDDLILFIERAGVPFVRRIVSHILEHDIPTAVGHPDLTIIGADVRFVEVKTSDRLHGTQGWWMRNVGRPLGLSVSIVRVLPE